MLITNHVLAGALVGATSPGPAAAFGLGVLSHAAMDAAPHFGNQAIFLRVAVVDGLLGLATMSWVARSTTRGKRNVVMAGMLGACFPDADKPALLFVGRSPFPAVVDHWHARIQHESPRRLPQEVAVAALGVLLVRRLVTRS